jgi:Mce-associated membrane protein
VAREVKVMLGVVVAALVFAGWGGWTWLQAGGDDSIAYANARDEVLSVARTQVATLTTLDAHDVDGGIDKWLAVSTGGLRDELSATDAKTRKTLSDQGTVATGRVLDAAVSELDTRSGTAKLLVSVEISTAKAGSPPVAKRNRFVAGMSRVDDGWKLSALDQVPLGAQ